MNTKIIEPTQDFDTTITFAQTGKMVFCIGKDGKLSKGDGLADDEMTRTIFDTLAANFPAFVGGIVAENAKLKVDLAAARDALKPFCEYYRLHATPNFDLLGCNGARLRPQHWQAALDAAKEKAP